MPQRSGAQTRCQCAEECGPEGRLFSSREYGNHIQRVQREREAHREAAEDLEEAIALMVGMTLSDESREDVDPWNGLWASSSRDEARTTPSQPYGRTAPAGPPPAAPEENTHGHSLGPGKKDKRERSARTVNARRALESIDVKVANFRLLLDQHFSEETMRECENGVAHLREALKKASRRTPELDVLRQGITERVSELESLVEAWRKANPRSVNEPVNFNCGERRPSLMRIRSDNIGITHRSSLPFSCRRL